MFDWYWDFIDNFCKCFNENFLNFGIRKRFNIILYFIIFFRFCNGSKYIIMWIFWIFVKLKYISSLRFLIGYKLENNLVIIIFVLFLYIFVWFDLINILIWLLKKDIFGFLILISFLLCKNIVKDNKYIYIVCWL